ncbi:hypothetical protein I3760_09G212500 [Carya illinoinensis]|nr:hypothetical protein I3760_09G212500 [Carya illinoinensis]
MQQIDSQFTAMGVEMQALRRQTEAMIQNMNSQFATMASDLQKMVAHKSVDAFNGESSNNNNGMVLHIGEVHTRANRLNFPSFNGENPHDWLYKVTQFFSFHNTLPQHHLRLTSFHMEGKALVWFQDLDEFGALTSWEVFVKILLLRFGPNKADSSHVQSHQPNLAFGLAKIQEEKISLRKKFNPKFHNSHPYEPNPLKLTSNLPVQPTPPDFNPKAIVPVHKISPTQMKERRAKVLCFSCDSKWHPSHRCQNPKLYLIEEVIEDNIFIEEPPDSFTDTAECWLDLSQTEKAPLKTISQPDK